MVKGIYILLLGCKLDLSAKGHNIPIQILCYHSTSGFKLQPLTDKIVLINPNFSSSLHIAQSKAFSLGRRWQKSLIFDGCGAKTPFIPTSVSCADSFSPRRSLWVVPLSNCARNRDLFRHGCHFERPQGVEKSVIPIKRTDCHAPSVLAMTTRTEQFSILHSQFSIKKRMHLAVHPFFSYLLLIFT